MDHEMFYERKERNLPRDFYNISLMIMFPPVCIVYGWI